MVITAEPQIDRLAPKSPLPYWRQVRELRSFHSGFEVLRDAGGPVTRLTLAPRWLMPPVVLTTSPQGAHDVLGCPGNGVDKAPVHEEMLHLLGPNLFDLKLQPWMSRRRLLQPIFTRKQVREFAGHMAQAARAVSGRWDDGAIIDLDTECRRLTLRALGRSVLGLSLDEHAQDIGQSLDAALSYIADRATTPLRPPRELPTPASRRARNASATLHRLAGDILGACRESPATAAPLVHALAQATDPETGQRLRDEEIRGELIAFMLAGHDTTATLLAYALWALGRHRFLQQELREEVAAFGDRELTPDDVPNLGYAVRILHEALRLCPPGAGVIRTATEEIHVDGYRVERGTILIVGVCAIHRDPALWDRPLVFDPDRFAPELMRGMDRWQYLPFGAGPRSCIGDHFAMLEAALALATIIQGFEIHSCSATFPLKSPFTTVADGPINVRVTQRCPAK